MVFALTSWIAPSAAWSMLRRHAADDVGSLKLVDLKLVKRDDDDYVAVHRSSDSSAVRERDGGGDDDGSHLLIVDWSRQRMTNDTMGHLMSLSVSMEIKERMLDLAWGKLAPRSELRSKPLPRGDRGTFDQHLLPYNRQHDNGGRPKTTLDGFGRRKPWTPDCIDDEFHNDNDSNDDDEMGFEVRFNEHLALHNNTQEQRSIDDTNATKLNSATRKYFEDQRRYDIVESNMRQQNNNDDDDDDNATTPTTSSENNGNKSGGSMHLAYRAPANKGLFMRDPYSNDKRKNVLDDIHNEWKRIQQITNNVRTGTTRGAISGRPICDVLVVCAGGIDVGAVLPHALEFIYRSLEHDATAYMASLVDVNHGSVTGRNEVVGATPSTTNTGGNSEATMEKKLKEVADGVVNMVTTPFKSKSATATTMSGIKSSTTAKSSNSSSGSSSSSSSLLRRRKLKVLTSLDPSAMMEVLSDLNPATTVVITINIDSEGENECQEITSFVKEWLLSMTTGIATTTTTTTSSSSRRAQNEEIVSKHMYLVTNQQQHSRTNKNNITSSNNTFVLPLHSQCEAFSTCSPAGLLPLSFIFGWDVVSSILLGVHDMDIHFVDTCPRQNIPIILALIDVWNEAFLQSNGRILTPYVHAFGSYPRYVAALEHRVLNATANMPETKSFGSRGRNEEPQPVIDGGSNVYNNYGRGGGGGCSGGGSSSSSSSSNLASTEFLTTLDPPILPLVGYSSSTAIGSASHEEQLITNHDKRMCSLFARADTLAYGTSNTANHKARIFHSPGSPPTIIRNDTMTSQNDDDGGGAGGSSAKIEIGNQPSTILFCGKCDAFTIGQLIALCEHRALIKAWLWGIDPFMITRSSGVQQERQEYLSEKLYIYNNLLNEGVDLDEADGSNESPSDSSTTGGGGGGGGGGARMMNSATNTVLKHYATRLKHRRRDDKPRTPSRLFS